MNNAKIKDPSQAAHDYVYRGLRTRIMHGEILPATSMTLRGIGKDYSVSMTPAREAVRRLIAEGALMFSPSGRVSTAELTHDRIEELAVMRSLIEVELASRALPRAHIALIDRLKAINASVSQAIALNVASGVGSRRFPIVAMSAVAALEALTKTSVEPAKTGIFG